MSDKSMRLYIVYLLIFCQILVGKAQQVNSLKNGSKDQHIFASRKLAEASDNRFVMRSLAQDDQVQKRFDQSLDKGQQVKYANDAENSDEIGRDFDQKLNQVKSNIKNPSNGQNVSTKFQDILGKANLSSGVGEPLPSDTKKIFENSLKDTKAAKLSSEKTSKFEKALKQAKKNKNSDFTSKLFSIYDDNSPSEGVSKKFNDALETGEGQKNTHTSLQSKIADNNTDTGGHFSSENISKKFNEALGKFQKLGDKSTSKKVKNSIKSMEKDEGSDVSISSGIKDNFENALDDANEDKRGLGMKKKDEGVKKAKIVKKVKDMDKKVEKTLEPKNKGSSSKLKPEIKTKAKASKKVKEIKKGLKKADKSLEKSANGQKKGENSLEQDFEEAIRSTDKNSTENLEKGTQRLQSTYDKLKKQQDPKQNIEKQTKKLETTYKHLKSQQYTSKIHSQEKSRADTDKKNQQLKKQMIALQKKQKAKSSKPATTVKTTKPYKLKINQPQIPAKKLIKKPTKPKTPKTKSTKTKRSSAKTGLPKNFYETNSQAKNKKKHNEMHRKKDTIKKILNGESKSQRFHDLKLMKIGAAYAEKRIKTDIKRKKFLTDLELKNSDKADKMKDYTRMNSTMPSNQRIENIVKLWHANRHKVDSDDHGYIEMDYTLKKHKRNRILAQFSHTKNVSNQKRVYKYWEFPNLQARVEDFSKKSFAQQLILRSLAQKAAETRKNNPKTNHSQKPKIKSQTASKSSSPSPTTKGTPVLGGPKLTADSGSIKMSKSKAQPVFKKSIGTVVKQIYGKNRKDFVNNAAYKAHKKKNDYKNLKQSKYTKKINRWKKVIYYMLKKKLLTKGIETKDFKFKLLKKRSPMAKLVNKEWIKDRKKKFIKGEISRKGTISGGKNLKVKKSKVKKRNNKMIQPQKYHDFLSLKDKLNSKHPSKIKRNLVIEYSIAKLPSVNALKSVGKSRRAMKAAKKITQPKPHKVLKILAQVVKKPNPKKFKSYKKHFKGVRPPKTALKSQLNIQFVNGHPKGSIRSSNKNGHNKLPPHSIYNVKTNKDVIYQMKQQLIQGQEQSQKMQGIHKHTLANSALTHPTKYIMVVPYPKIVKKEKEAALHQELKAIKSCNGPGCNKLKKKLQGRTVKAVMKYRQGGKTIARINGPISTNVKGALDKLSKTIKTDKSKLKTATKKYKAHEAKKEAKAKMLKKKKEGQEKAQATLVKHDIKKVIHK